MTKVLHRIEWEEWTNEGRITVRSKLFDNWGIAQEFIKYLRSREEPASITHVSKIFAEVKG